MPTHAEQRQLPHQPRELYELVADVGRYPEFLPWCVAARVREKDAKHVVADLVIGFRMVRERFTSKVTLRDEPEQPLRIDVAYVEGPFRYLNNHWIFYEQDGGTLLDFYVDFEFRSKLLQTMIQPLFNEAVRRMVGAFETRADQLYGPEDGG